MLRRWVAVTAVAATLLTGGCTTPHTAPVPSTPAVTQTVPAGKPGSRWALVDVDQHGAIVLHLTASGPPRLAGMSRDGATRWRADTLAVRAPNLVCESACPTAIASSSLASANDPAVRDPAPVLLGGRERLTFAAGHKRRVLSSGPHGLVQATTSPRGESALLIGSGSTVRRTRLAGPDTSWRESNDERVAVALTPSAGRGSIAVRLFTAADQGWRPAGAVARSNSLFGCAGDDGHYVISDPAPVLVDRSGRRVRIQGLESGGDCGFTKDGAVVVQYAMTTTGQETRLVTVGPNGAVKSDSSYPFEAHIATDLGGCGYLVMLKGSAEERDLAGNVLQKFDGVDDARYDERGDIVAVNRTGEISWMPGKC